MLNLIGTKPTARQVKWFSAELNVKKNTPPAFIVHAADDSTALVENSIAYFNALHHFKIASELFVYQKGGHGFANYNKLEQDNWLEKAIKWMKLNNYLR